MQPYTPTLAAASALPTERATKGLYVDLSSNNLFAFVDGGWINVTAATAVSTTATLLAAISALITAAVSAAVGDATTLYTTGALVGTGSINDPMDVDLDAASVIPVSGWTLNEQDPVPSAPEVAHARLYADRSGGKTRLMVRFNTGSAVQLAVEP